jgi:hypothetical protein
MSLSQLIYYHYFKPEIFSRISTDPDEGNPPAAMIPNVGGSLL